MRGVPTGHDSQMNAGAGITLIAAGGFLALVLIVAGWRRLSEAGALGAVGAAGLLVGAGALLLQEAVSAGEWAVALAAFGVLAPVHARLVLGRPGRSP